MVGWIDKIGEKWRRLPVLFKILIVVAVLACGFLPNIHVPTIEPPTPPVEAGFEDFTTYTEVDQTPSCLAINSTAVNVDNLERDEDCYVYKDFGAGYFTDFEHKFEVRGRDSDATGGNDVCFYWMLAHDVADARYIDVNLQHDYLGFRLSEFTSEDPDDPQMFLMECDNGTLYYDTNDTWVLIDTWYYVTVVKSGTSFYSEVRTGSHTGTLKENFTVTLQEDYSFRYLYCVNGHNNGASYRSSSGDVRNLELVEEAATPNEVTLNSPADNQQINNTFTWTFNYTPVIYTENIKNASLHTNESSWNVAEDWNASAVVNNTVNSITHTFSGYGTYKWSIQVFNTSGVGTWATTNRTKKVVKLPNDVTLNYPSDSAEVGKQLTITFNFTPTLYWGNIKNSSLHVDEIDWSTHHWNTSAVTNATVNTIDYTFSDYGTYIWNVEVFNSTGSQWATSNFTVTLEDYWMVTHSIDDSKYDNDGDSWDETASDLRIQSHSGEAESYYDSGILFQINLQQGAEIHSANLSLYVYSTIADDCDFTIYGNDVDNADTFNHGTEPKSRTKTTASYTYTDDGIGSGWHDFNVTDIMQEILDRSGWQSGNNMSFLLLATTSTSDWLGCRSWDYSDHSLAPRLYANYTLHNPEASNVTATPHTGAMNDFSARWSTPIGSLDSYRIGHNGSGSFTWQNWQSFDGNIWSNLSINVGWISIGDILEWKIEANNTEGYVGSTGSQTFQVTPICYGTEHTLSVTSFTGNMNTTGNLAVAKPAGITFSADGWQEEDVNDTIATHLQLYYIITANTDNNLTGYELEYWDGDSWESPTSVVSSCGEETGHQDDYFIDGNTGTSWQHNNVDWHIIKVELSNGAFVTIEKIRVYGIGAEDECDWSSIQEIRTTTYWSTAGSEPWLNSASKSNKLTKGGKGADFGSFEFEDISQNQTIIKTKLEVEYKGDIIISYHNDRGEWTQLDDYAFSSSWTIVNSSLTFINSPLYLNDFKINVTSDSTYATEVNYAKLHYTVETKNQTIRRIWDTAYYRRVNSTFPFIRAYDAGDESWYHTADASLLVGAMFYELTGNQSYLDAANQVADYLNSSDITDLFDDWNVTSGSWANATTGGSAHFLPLYSLANLAKNNVTWNDLLQTAVDKFIGLFVNQSSGMIYPSYRNGNPREEKVNSIHQFSSLSSLGFAGRILGNTTVKEQALDCLLKWPRGSYYLPYHMAYRNGTGDSANDYAKTTTTGAWILAASQLYYLTSNQTLYATWLNVSEYAVYYSWNDTYYELPLYGLEQISGEPRSDTSGWDGQFEYRTEVNTGRTGWDGMVKGKWYLMEGLIHSFLLFQNQTYLDRLATELHFTFINGTDRAATVGTRPSYGSHMVHDILAHGSVGFTVTSDNAQDSDLVRTSTAMRTLQLFYNLNYTANFDCQHTSGQIHSYQDSKWLESWNRVYWATMNSHYSDYGITNMLSSCWSLDPVGKGVSADLTIFFKYFMNKTAQSEALNSFTDIYENWGNPWTGESIPVSPIDVGWNTITLWTVDYDKSFTQVNASLWSDSINYTHFTVEWSNGTRLVFRVGETWNAAVIITTDAETIYIWALEAGSWSHIY